MNADKQKFIIGLLVIVNLLLLHVYNSIGQPNVIIFRVTHDTAFLAWDANSEEDLSHYTVYTHFPDTTKMVNVYNRLTSAEIKLDLSTYFQTVYFTVTASDVNGNESGHSERIGALFCQEAGRLYGDVNNDNLVDIEDWTIIYLRRGSRPWYVNWSDRCDLNGDGLIDVEDSAICYARKGERL